MYISPLQSDPSMKYHSLTFRNLPSKKIHRILKAASMEFSHNGYKSTSINIIAQKSNVSVGAIYKYFRSKQNLYLLTVATGIYPFKTLLENILSSEQPLDKKLEQLIASIQRAGKSHEKYINLYMELISARSANLITGVIKEIELVSVNAFIALLTRGQESGQIRKDMDPRLGAFYLDSLLKTLLVSYSTGYSRERLRIYTSSDILDQDQLILEETLKFILGVLAPTATEIFY